MSKLADQLRAMGVHNNHELLKRFAKRGKGVCVSFRGDGPMGIPNAATLVWSPRFRVDPSAHFMDHGARAFDGRKRDTEPLAVAWASKQYGITEWATSPFGGKIPKAAKDAAVKAAREAERDGKP